MIGVCFLNKIFFNDFISVVFQFDIDVVLRRGTLRLQTKNLKHFFVLKTMDTFTQKYKILDN